MIYISIQQRKFIFESRVSFDSLIRPIECEKVMIFIIWLVS